MATMNVIEFGFGIKFQWCYIVWNLYWVDVKLDL